MTFNDFLKQPASKKITIVEIDVPLELTWINYAPGIWQGMVAPGNQLIPDDNGNTGYWDGKNSQYKNINSLNIDGGQYSEVASLALCISTNKTWFYDTDTRFYIHLDSWEPPEVYQIIALGAVMGFTDQIDRTCNNYFEDIYYEPLIKSIPNLSKQKDSLFYGILQFQGGSVSFDNTSGYFDRLTGLYNQPIRIRLTFEGLDYTDSLLVYSGRIGRSQQDYETYNLTINDIRQRLSRQLPINVFDSTTYPSIDSKLLGTPIPLIFGSVINVPAYKTSSGHWTFADVTHNLIDSGITVYNKKTEAVFSHSGTGIDGTFTGADTDDKLYVTCSQSTIENGLDVITHLLATYEGTEYNTLNYNTAEWEIEKLDVKNIGIWIGKGNLKTSVDIIEQVCTDNQGIFDVLADGRFTFRTFDPDRTPTYEIFQDELLYPPVKDNNDDEFLSSVKIEYSENLLTGEPVLFTNDDFESEVYGRYRQHKEKTFTTRLTNETDAIVLSEAIMNFSKFIFPSLELVTKTQNVGIKILDSLLYTYARQNGNSIIDRSRYQVLGTMLNLSSYEMSISVKQIETDDKKYHIFDGGDSTTDYDYYDGGSSL